ncbi:PPE family protein [Mycobacterium sp. Marseille-P9652]|uniref:triacylglycerol lipase LipY n=1 Tax=Mycobacterium sp. Marseille-P9652 TaxID=2654950 RepID=UPI0018CFF062|nr:PPE family protein [Mycobacterium sp. Marseille-P9652]
MSFSVLPPEINSLLLLDGPGSGPLLEAASAWDGIVSELSSAASGYGSVTSDLTAAAWQGPSSASMTNAVSRYVDWLGNAAAQAEQSAAQARAAASAYEAALATIVDPSLVQANRGQLVSLVLSNLFGQNAPAIAAAEAEYEQMWAHDVAVMSGYHASASATVAHLGQWELALENLPGLPGGAAAAATNGFALIEQEIQQTTTALTTGFTGVANNIFINIFGQPATPFSALTGGTYNGTPSLATRIEEAALLPVKPLLTFSGLEPTLSNPTNPLLQFLASDAPPLSWVLGNEPPPFLNLLLGETVSYTNYQGMNVVQITPAHPTGDVVVAIHGGAFILPPSIFHWIDYSVTAYQTGATFEVPIYPLLQQGGTAGTVVPLMASYINSVVTQPGAPHVSVIGDSAGGNLALAAAEYLVGHGGHLPASMVLLSPWLDVSMTNPNIPLVADPLLPVGPAQDIGRAWAGALSVKDPMVSPLYGSLNGLPPTYVYSGNMDILSPDTLVLEQKALTAHVPMNFVLAAGQIHDWVILTLDGPQYWPQIDQELGI